MRNNKTNVTATATYRKCKSVYDSYWQVDVWYKKRLIWSWAYFNTPNSNGRNEARAKVREWIKQPKSVILELTKAQSGVK